MIKTKNQKLVQDPVCGMVKPKNQMRAKAIYKGKMYYFCYRGDKEIFKSHPEHWASQKNKNLKAKNQNE